MKIIRLEDFRESNGGENILSDMAALDNKKIYYRRSLLDSTLFAVNESGDVFQHMIYDAWGNPSIATKLDANYMGVQNLNNFTGYTWDETLGLYFAQNRFYDSVFHRFTQEDLIKDGSNWFSYCGNNPLTYVDVWGLASWIIYDKDAEAGTPGKLFRDEANIYWAQLKEYYGYNEPVYIKGVSSAAEFVTYWNNSVGKDTYGNSVRIDEVIVIAHGSIDGPKGSTSTGYMSFGYNPNGNNITNLYARPYGKGNLSVKTYIQRRCHIYV